MSRLRRVNVFNYPLVVIRNDDERKKDCTLTNMEIIELVMCMCCVGNNISKIIYYI